MKIFSIFVLSLSLIAAAAQAADSYHIVKKIPIPGQGSWDYLAVDEGAHRLYVSHGTQVEVIDVDSGAIVGKVEKTLGVHGIAIAPELGRGFISNGQTATVTIFDLKTLKPIGEAPTSKASSGLSTKYKSQKAGVASRTMRRLRMWAARDFHTK